MKIYILIYIYHGIIQEPQVFKTKEKLMKKYNALKKKIRPEYDEVGYFEKII